MAFVRHGLASRALPDQRTIDTRTCLHQKALLDRRDIGWPLAVIEDLLCIFLCVLIGLLIER